MNRLVLPFIVLLLATIPSESVPAYTEGGTFVDNEVVIAMNELTYTIANQHDHFYSFIGVRALAMVHLAMHDIFCANDPQFERYYWNGNLGGAHPISAAVESTRSLLVSAYPDRRDTINLVCHRWQQKISAGAAKRKGQKIGAEVAAAYLLLRNHDGHEKEGDYTPMTKPGNYQYTPGNNNWVLKPDFSVAHPFTLDSVTQFRSPPPPGLQSLAYTQSYRESKAYGSKGSKVRTEDQTRYAHWWAEFGEHSWNRVGRITAKERHLPLMETNRMFALFNMNLYDLYLASLESKYFYDTWRPYTAIREGDSDGNPETIADPFWEPEMKTPPWPEYPSAHAAVGASGAEILDEVYGTSKVSFRMESVTALPDARIRMYSDLYDAARECADSRIMNGFHFRFATEEGKRQGILISRHTLSHFLRPLPLSTTPSEKG